MSTALTPTAAKEFDIRYYADLLWRGRVFVASAAFVGMGLGGLAAWLQVPAYQASAMVQIEPPTPTFMSVTDALVGAGGYWQNTDFYNTQFRILRSKSLGEQAVERLKLAERPPFKGAPEPGSVFMGHVSISPIAESRLVLIQATHTDPKEAALWANTLADVYIEQSLTNRIESAKRAYEWLQERMAATQKSMRDAQERLLKTYESQDLFVPEGSVSAVSTSIAKLNEDYIDARSRRIGLEAALKQVADMRGRGQSLDSVPQVSADSLIADLNGQLSGMSLEMSRLKEKFKEAHPEVQKVQAQMDQIRKAKDSRALQIVDGLRSEYAQLQKRESELRGAIDEQKSLGASQSRKATELETVKKEAESAKSLYEVLLQKLNETDIAASIRTNNVTLVEKASVPLSPVRPDKKRIAGAGLLLGLLLGVGLVLGRDYLDNTIKDPEEMERYLHLDLLAAVPRYEEANAHLVTEAYQNLRTALLFARKSEGGQIVLITSTAPQEGKTTTLVNLAKLLAASGEKTIVLDFDLRRAQLHGRLGLTREPGLTNFFAKHEAIETLARPTRVPNLFALTAGPLPPNPPALLARKDLSDFLDQLRRDYEWVLLDSPPLASVTDALLLARHADITVFVVQHNKIDKKLVKRNVAALRKATPHLLGAVLNGVDVKSKGYYYYYYHQEQPSQPGAAAPAPGAAARKSSPRPVSAAKH
jgi:capsular exopolysaccharide synthesis family protein